MRPSNVSTNRLVAFLSPASPFSHSTSTNSPPTPSMFSSESLPPPPRSLRVNINDLLNPVRPSGTEVGSPPSVLQIPSAPPSANVSAHTHMLPGFDSLGGLPYERRARDSQHRSAVQLSPSRMRTEQSRSRRMDGHQFMDAPLVRDTHVTPHDEQASFSLRSAQWIPTHANAGDSRLGLPPLQPVREFKTEPWQMAPLSASLHERHYAGDAGPDSINARRSAHSRAVHRPSVMLPSPSSTSSSASPHTLSPILGFTASHLNSAPAMMAIPHSPYGHQQRTPQEANCPTPPVMLGPRGYAHHPHLAESPRLVPFAKPPSAHSPIMLSPITPPKHEYNASFSASPTIMGAIDPSATNLQAAERASVRVAARGSKTPTPTTTRDESAFVLQLHPTEQPQQNVRQRKRTLSDAGFNEGGTSPAPHSSASSESSLSSLSSLDSVASDIGGHVVEDAQETKKAKGKGKAVTLPAANTAPKKAGKTSKKRNGSEENEAGGSAKSSRKGKEKEKAIAPSSHGYTSGQLQPLDPQMTMRLGYGVGVVPVRETVPLYPFGYASYPMPMHMHPLGIPVAVAAPQNQPLGGKLFPELQYARCMSARYKADPFPRCVSCTRRWAGDTCRFQNIRILLRDSNKILWAVGFQDLSAKGQGAQMIYPDQWNVKLDKRQVDRTMETVAKSLLPHLQKEQAHQQLGSVVKRQRETDVRATCDTCMTSLFSSSWMCRQCGREACEECYQTIRRLTAELTPAASSAPNGKAKGAAASSTDQRTMKERHAQSNPFFLSCNRKAEHGVHTFVPVTRFVRSELDYAVTEMERLVKKDDEARRNAKAGATEGGERSREPTEGGIEGDTENTAMDVDTPQVPTFRSMEEKRTNKDSMEIVDESPANSSKSLTPEHYNDGICTLIENPIPPPRSDISLPSAHLPPTSSTPLGTPSWPVPYYTVETLTEPVFAAQWARGTPLVVTGLLDRLNLRWTPEYFINTYGAQPCIVLECQTDANKKVTVGEFFSCFGRYEGRTECWKLKDWPPSTDFKTAFPELYEDFSRAVPVPNYSRRDGALNIASHFPTNTISPDLGPKMYNAYASTDQPGSKGSTRLHMDMADAVNIMVHSELTADGAPGCAAWDIFRAEDSGHLRSFFKKNFKGQYQNDPIHAQHFYLDPTLRAQLFAEFGVRSFRIYQRPGEAVFIPAGCAHQVCNFADSIKVACDFVSPENVERCEALTREFRAQNQSLVWKEDVLQLRSMMWFAWLSCRQQQEKWSAEERHPEPVAEEDPISNEGRAKEGMRAEI